MVRYAQQIVPRQPVVDQSLLYRPADVATQQEVHTGALDADDAGTVIAKIR